MKPRPKSRFLAQLGWLIGIWAASVIALGLAAWALRSVMAAAGMVR